MLSTPSLFYAILFILNQAAGETRCRGPWVDWVQRLSFFSAPAVNYLSDLVLISEGLQSVVLCARVL